MYVKICANKSIDDAFSCISAGADFMGLLVGKEHFSNDFISPDTAKSISEYAKGKINTVLVTHLVNANQIIELAKFIGCTHIQLHSDVSENEVKIIKDALNSVKLIKLIHLNKDGTPKNDTNRCLYADYYITDSFNTSTNQVGGTGITYNFENAGKVIESLDKPVFMAGGLNPKNIADAIKLAKPFAVDVNSGVKDENGNKDFDKIKAFVLNAKNA